MEVHTLPSERHSKESVRMVLKKSLVTGPTLADGINRKSEFVIVAVCTTICVAAKCPDLVGIELYGIE